MKSNIALKGFFRISIEDENGNIVGDSGWKENLITNEGFSRYISKLMIADANSLRVSHLALGSGTAPTVDSTTLDGEHLKRKSATSLEIASKTVQFSATFGSSDSFVTNTATLANIGLFNASSGGYLFAGNTFNSSQVATNQNVNVTYQIRFS